MKQEKFWLFLSLAKYIRDTYKELKPFKVDKDGEIIEDIRDTYKELKHVLKDKIIYTLKKY